MTLPMPEFQEPMPTFDIPPNAEAGIDALAVGDKVSLLVTYEVIGKTEDDILIRISEISSQTNKRLSARERNV